MAHGPYLESRKESLRREAEQLMQNAADHDREAARCRENANLCRKMLAYLEGKTASPLA